MFLILEGYSFSRWTQQGDFLSNLIQITIYFSPVRTTNQYHSFYSQPVKVSTEMNVLCAKKSTRLLRDSLRKPWTYTPFLPPVSEEATHSGHSNESDRCSLSWFMSVRLFTVPAESETSGQSLNGSQCWLQEGFPRELFKMYLKLSPPLGKISLPLGMIQKSHCNTLDIWILNISLIFNVIVFYGDLFRMPAPGILGRKTLCQQAQWAF